MSDQNRKAFEVEWRIENLGSWFQNRDDPLYSHKFHAKTLTNARWKLSLSRKSYMAEKYICLALTRDIDLEDDNPEPIAMNYELSFLACDGSRLKSKSCTTKFAPKSVSQELNVEEVEILKEKKDAYLPEGVLTVSCKLWKAWFTSKGEHCSILSVIGKNCITLEGTIDDFSRLRAYNYSALRANFMSSSSDISFISFDVKAVRSQTYYLIHFEKVKVECKFLNFDSFQLFALDASGERKEFYNGSERASLLISNKPYSFTTCYKPFYETYWDAYNNYVKNNILTLLLQITYYPGIKSECIEYDGNNCKKPNDDSADLENVNISSSETLHSRPLDCLHLIGNEEKTFDIEKNEFKDEDECSDAAGKKHLSSTTLKEDLSSLYNDRLFCDTKLQTDTETFHAHRNVLSARSPVFKKMFTTEMKEKAGECINIPDISSDTVRRMLQFLYTDCTGDLDRQSAKDLYIASDKYDIASLKQRCSSFMKKNLCPANVCEVLVLADMHQDKSLESAAQEYVLTYDDEVFNSDEWKLFMKNYSCLAAQVMYLKCTKK